MRYFWLLNLVSGLLVSPVAFAQRIDAGPLPAYYNVRTGNLTIDSTNVFGGLSIGYVLSGDIGWLRSENHTPFMDTLFVTSAPREISEVSLDSPVPGGVYSLGNILPEGLTEEELIEEYFWAERLGPFAGSPFSDRTFYVSSGLGLSRYHVLQPVYSPSPFPPLNDDTIGPPEIERWAEEVSLSYNAQTGGLMLDTTGENGGAIWSYKIVLNDALLDVDAFVPVGDGVLAKVDVDSIIEIGFSGIPEGVYSLGPILPSGMDNVELTSLIDRIRFVGEPGHSVESLDIDVNGINMSVDYIVPEPSGALLGLIATWLLMLNTKRARTKP